ncbi:MAG: methylenetetrahydrofolate reductase [Myxococcota bacterium]|jgi:methylenetetrahydrofolate reductase (NADPH)|nr:methylenetetrahydrofolate reductase [Myxococcota bacterium]
MKLSSRWSSGKPTVSFEVFPQHDEKGRVRLGKVIEKLVALRPDFMGVTFGAGGSTREGSRDLVEDLRRLGVEVLAYFAGLGLGPRHIDAVLGSYQELGVENLLLIRGDEPAALEGFVHDEQSMAHASDLVSYVKPRFDLCLGVAGYPEGHVQAKDLKTDLKYLKLKVDEGATFILTNYFYDNYYYFNFVKNCREMGITVPIVPGVMPIFNFGLLESLAKTCGATITERVQQGLGALDPNNKEAVADFGVAFAIEQCEELLRKGAPGIHLYSMDRAKSVETIVEELRARGVL